jgi:hypothetical protein
VFNVFTISWCFQFWNFVLISNWFKSKLFSWLWRNWFLMRHILWWSKLTRNRECFQLNWIFSFQPRKMFWALISWLGIVIFCYRIFLRSVFQLKFLATQKSSPFDKKVEKRFMFIEQNHILTVFRFEFSLVWSSNGLDVIIRDLIVNRKITYSSCPGFLFLLCWTFANGDNVTLRFKEWEWHCGFSCVSSKLIYCLRHKLAFTNIAYRWTSLVLFVSSIIVKYFKA